MSDESKLALLIAGIAVYLMWRHATVHTAKYAGAPGKASRASQGCTQ